MVHWRVDGIYTGNFLIRSIGLMAVPTPDQELWAVAIWLDRTQGSSGPDYIQEQVERLAKAGDKDGIEVWLQIAERYDKLKRPAAPPN